MAFFIVWSQLIYSLTSKHIFRFLYRIEQSIIFLQVFKKQSLTFLKEKINYHINFI